MRMEEAKLAVGFKGSDADWQVEWLAIESLNEAVRINSKLSSDEVVEIVDVSEYLENFPGTGFKTVEWLFILGYVKDRTSYKELAIWCTYYCDECERWVDSELDSFYQVCTDCLNRWEQEKVDREGEGEDPMDVYKRYSEQTKED